jgi:hypothetical protein
MMYDIRWVEFIATDGTIMANRGDLQSTLDMTTFKPEAFSLAVHSIYPRLSGTPLQGIYGTSSYKTDTLRL